MAATLLVSLFTAVSSAASVSAAQVSSANVQALAPGVAIAGAPAVCSQGANSIDLFVRGSDNALWWKHWDGTAWSTSTSLGANLTSDPTVAATNNSLTVAARGVDGALWRISSYNGTWSDWTSVGGKLLVGTGPTEFSWVYEANPSVGTFVTGTNHALYYYWWSTGWSNLGGYLTSSPGAAASPDASGHGYYIDVFARGGNGALWWKTTSGAPSGASWSAWMSAGGI